MLFALLFVGVTASLRLQQPAGNPLGGTATMRQWYLCSGPSSGTATAAEYQAGIQASQDLTCTREFTFRELCCADFTRLDDYLTLGNTGPYHGARQVTMTSEAAQVPEGTSAYTVSLVNDAAGLPRQTPTLRLCTTQYDTGEIAPSGEPVRVTGQLCDKEEFLPADLDGGSLVLDVRIAFLEKQGLPGSSIPVCWEQFQTGEACPAASARVQNGKTGFNSASPAVLERIGKNPPLAAAVQIEEDFAKWPGNAHLTAAESQGKLGLERKHRTDIRTLESLVGLSAPEIRTLLGDRSFDLGLNGTVMRLHVVKVTSGDETRIAGTLDGQPAEVQISRKQAALVRGGRRSELGLDDVVLSTIGATAGRNMLGALMTSGSFTMMAAGGN